MAHILIVESNTPELVAESRSQGRLSEADNYASVLGQINAALRITSVALYAGEALPPLKNVSGVVFTGSGVAWCVDDPRAPCALYVRPACPPMGHAMGCKWRRMFWGAHAVRHLRGVKMVWP